MLPKNKTQWVLPFVSLVSLFVVGIFLNSKNNVEAAAPNCINWPSGKSIQTPFDYKANNNTGYVDLVYDFYGEGLHTTCNRSTAVNDYHAIDYKLNNGDNVLPYSPGKVVAANWTSGGFAGFGRTVVIDHGGGYTSLYAHLSQINVTVGQNVGIDTVIGKVGTSRYNADNQTVPHLHAAIYYNGKFSGGAVYGGVGVEPKNIKYFRSGGGIYSNFYKNQRISY